MIKTSELMIGNLVLIEGLPTFVTGLLGSKIYYNGHSGLIKGIQYATEEASGISLTPEWFEKFGFEYHLGDWVKNNVHIGDYSGSEGMGSEYRLAIEDWILFEAAEIKYVHQLQNVYFTLIAEELSIK